MKARNLLTKILAGVLVAVMVLGMVPVFASATESTDASGQLHLDKRVDLQNDGTYTIKLEAYATGSVSTSTSTVPTDVVLVLDVSGSMADVFETVEKEGTWNKVSIPIFGNQYWLLWLYQLSTTLYYNAGTADSPDYRQVEISDNKVIDKETGTVLHTGTDTSSVPNIDLYTYQKTEEEISKQQALKTAAKAFIDATAKKNAAITDPTQQHRISIVKFAGNSLDTVGNNTYSSSGYTYNNSQIVTTLTTVTTDTATDMKNTIDSLSAAGATSADYGMNHAERALFNTEFNTSTDTNRKKIVIMFTDGEPNHGNGFDTSVATATVNKAKDLKDKGVTVFTIGVLSGANPSLDPTLQSTSNINKYLHATSSNYPAATATGSFSVTWGDNGNYQNGYYKTAANADELNNVFTEIQNSVGSTSITLDAGAVMKDIVSDYFVLPSTVDGNVTIQTAPFTGVDANGAYTFGDAVTASGVTASIDGNTVSVTGFSYKDNYCVTVDSKNQGNKLIVTITGVLPKDSAFTGTSVDTNGDASGIYEDVNAAEPVAKFATGNDTLANQSYVLDYAKPVTVYASEWIQTAISSIMTKIAKTTDTLELNPSYGTITKNDASLIYTPNSMKWDGYDSFYTFQSADAEVDRSWAKVNFIPANNVYYEDSFVASSEATADAGAGIYFSEDWELVGATNNNTEMANEAVQGWISSLDEELGDSDGTSQHASAGATATFTFTGTGFDIYSRTNDKSGTILVQVTPDATAKAAGVTTKWLIIDTKSVSSDGASYYQIPTVSYTAADSEGNIVHGTYTVKLTVTSGAASEERLEYWLDGIRIYNPLSAETEADTTVSTAYGNSELNATFTEVRDLLISAADFDAKTTEVEGAIFIDEIKEDQVEDSTQTGEGVTSVTVGTYETYGPENEVYLASGQAITLKVADTSLNYQIGLKAPDGATTAAFSKDDANNSGTTINHAADMYYTVTPVNGFITIKNTGDQLLSVTKIKTSGVAEITGLSLLSVTADEAVEEVAAFSLRSTVAYTAEVEDETEETTPEETTPEETTPEETTPEESEPETPDIDIDIQNPTEPEKPEENHKPDRSEQIEQVKKLVGKIFDAFRGWFGR